MPNQNGKSVTDEYQALQLEELQYNVGKLRSQQRLRLLRQQGIERTLRAEERREAIKQAGCWHKKGGKGVEMMYRGNDSNYAVIKNVLPHGILIVICQRCLKLWAPPDPALNLRTATADERRLYARLYKEYQEAVNFPTDNETSGSQLFLITQGTPQATELTA
jgi:hypothetical protein